MPPAVNDANVTGSPTPTDPGFAPTPAGTAPGTAQVTQTAPVGGLSGAQITADNAAATANNALWYTFTGIGRAYLVQVGSEAAGQADLYSVHGYSTIGDAWANPNSGAGAGLTTGPTAGPSQLLITIWNGYASLPVGGGTLGMIETVSVTPPVAGTIAKPGTPGTSTTQQNPTIAGASAASGDIVKAINPLLGAGEAIEHFFDAIIGFYDLLTDKDMWISLGWLAVGSILLMIGIVMFVIKKAGPGIEAAAPLAMAAA
jgi:hypothetical protein